jgi:hypothetical protein
MGKAAQETVVKIVGSTCLYGIVSALGSYSPLPDFSVRYNPTPLRPTCLDMATNQKVGSSNLSGRAILFPCVYAASSEFCCFPIRFARNAVPNHCLTTRTTVRVKYSLLKSRTPTRNVYSRTAADHRS